MKDENCGDPSRALRSALGIHRLKSAAEVAFERKTLSSTWHDLEPSTQRLILSGLLILALAAAGFWHFVDRGREASAGQWLPLLVESAKKTVKLFTFQYSQQPGDGTFVASLSKWIFPAAAVFVAAISLSRRVGRRFFAWTVALGRNHVVLIGASDLSVALARSYRQRLHRRVIAILSDEPAKALSPIERAGADVVVGSPLQASTLRRAGVHRALHCIAAEDISDALIGLGTAVAEVGRRRARNLPPLPLVMRLGHRELREVVTAHLSQSMSHSKVDLRLYVRERTIVRALLARYPVDWGLSPGPHDLHVAVFGLGEMGTELLLQLARVAVPRPGYRTVLTVIDRDADALKERLLGDFPNLGRCAELRFKNVELRSWTITEADIRDWLLDPIAVTSIYVCCGQDLLNLSIALGLRRAYSRGGIVSPAIFVDQHTQAAQVQALPQIHGAGIDTLRIIGFGGIEEEADPVFLVEEEIDDLARRLHENYLNMEMAQGPAAVPWPQLDESFRSANRSLADHLQLKLRALNLHATASGERKEPVHWTWDTDERQSIEALSEQEHDRWCRERWLAGWNQGAKRDDLRKVHPDLVPFENLVGPARDKDRAIILNLPKQLALLGIGLKRDRRIGIWFYSMEVAPSKALIQELLTALDRRRELEPAVHWQLVLPLRVSAEWDVANALADRTDVGTDVAIIRYPGHDDIGPMLDRAIVQKMIAVSDRAFVLTPLVKAGLSSGGAQLLALCDICDTVLLVGDDIRLLSELRHQVGEIRKERIECVGGAS